METSYTEVVPLRELKLARAETEQVRAEGEERLAALQQVLQQERETEVFRTPRPDWNRSAPRPRAAYFCRVRNNEFKNRLMTRLASSVGLFGYREKIFPASPGTCLSHPFPSPHLSQGGGVRAWRRRRVEPAAVQPAEQRRHAGAARPAVGARSGHLHRSGESAGCWSRELGQVCVVSCVLWWWLVSCYMLRQGTPYASGSVGRTSFRGKFPGCSAYTRISGK